MRHKSRPSWPVVFRGDPGMGYEEIIELIGQASGDLSSEAAERAAQATLRTLAERLPAGRRPTSCKSCPLI
jgi:hypothetical protein